MCINFVYFKYICTRSVKGYLKQTLMLFFFYCRQMINVGGDLSIYLQSKYFPHFVRVNRKYNLTIKRIRFQKRFVKNSIYQQKQPPNGRTKQKQMFVRNSSNQHSKNKDAQIFLVLSSLFNISITITINSKTVKVKMPLNLTLTLFSSVFIKQD